MFCDNVTDNSAVLAIMQDGVQSHLHVRQLRGSRDARERRGGAAEQRHVLRLSRLLQVQRPLQTRR